MLRLTPTIDRAQCEFFSRLRSLPSREQRAIVEAIKCGCTRDLIAEIFDTLLAIDPVLAGLWSVWREALAVDAWAAVLKLAFIKDQLLAEAQQQSQPLPHAAEGRITSCQ
jgi:hypothetical protein